MGGKRRIRLENRRRRMQNRNRAREERRIQKEIEREKEKENERETERENEREKEKAAQNKHDPIVVSALTDVSELHETGIRFENITIWEQNCINAREKYEKEEKETAPQRGDDLIIVNALNESRKL